MNDRNLRSNRLRTIIALLILGLALAAFGLYLRSREAQHPRTEGQTATAVSSESSRREVPPGPTPDASVPVPPKTLNDLLTSRDKNRWVTAEHLYLKNMPLSELYRTISAPAVSDQLQAKSMRYQILGPCLAFIQGATAQLANSLVDHGCSELTKVDDADHLHDQYMTLKHDPELQAADYRIPMSDPTKLSDDQRQTEWTLAENQISTSQDPYLVGSAVRHLWWSQSPDLAPDWSTIAALDSYQQDILMQFIATDSSCMVVGGCGPESPWTISFCATEPHVLCPPGSSFDTVATLNLSPIQQTLRQQILSRIRQLLYGQPQ